MYQFISCIKLKPNVTVESFRQSLEQFTEHLLAEGLVVSVSPLGRRDRQGPHRPNALRTHDPLPARLPSSPHPPDRQTAPAHA